jgi:hypothetical protein
MPRVAWRLASGSAARLWSRKNLHVAQVLLGRGAATQLESRPYRQPVARMCEDRDIDGLFPGGVCVDRRTGRGVEEENRNLGIARGDVVPPGLTVLISTWMVSDLSFDVCTRWTLVFLHALPVTAA